MVTSKGEYQGEIKETSCSFFYIFIMSPSLKACSHFSVCVVFAETLSPLAVNFKDPWWPLQTIWIQMKPHKTWGFISDPNCLSFRLYISKKMGGNYEFFENFERNKYLKKIPSMQREFFCLTGHLLPYCSYSCSSFLSSSYVQRPTLRLGSKQFCHLCTIQRQVVSKRRIIKITNWMLGNF